MEKSEESKDDAPEGAVGYEVLDCLTEDLSRSRSFGSDKWTARCIALQELLGHHIDEEAARLELSDALGRRHPKRHPSSRTGEHPPYGMIGGIEETSASFEARSAPRLRGRQ